MPISGILCCVPLVGTDVSEERSTSITRVIIGELTANVVPSSSILVTQMMEALPSETSVLTRATRRNITEDGILLKQFLIPIRQTQRQERVMKTGCRPTNHCTRDFKDGWVEITKECCYKLHLRMSKIVLTTVKSSFLIPLQGVLF
jgi:hypothetical protein